MSVNTKKSRFYSYSRNKKFIIYGTHQNVPINMLLFETLRTLLQLPSIIPIKSLIPERLLEEVTKKI